MRAIANVTPPPAPVGTTHIEFEYRYFVVRGDGATKVFDSLWERVDPTKPPKPWTPAGHMGFHPTNSSGFGNLPVIDIPIDMFTALRLGLIEFNELELPEGFRALLNIIK